MTLATAPRVTFIAQGVHDRGGMERAAAELIRRGWAHIRFTVIASDVAPDVAEHCTWIRVNAPSRPFSLRYPTFVARASQLARHVEADIVHDLGVNTVGITLDCITFQWCQAGAVEAMGGKGPRSAPIVRRANTAMVKTMALAAERRAMRHRPMALCVSPGVGREVERHYPGTSVNITPNGVDPERFRPDSATRAAVRREHGVDPATVVFVFLGGDWDRKGLPAAIEGLGQARRGGADVALWVIGGGDITRFSALADRAGLADHYRFFGTRNDPETLLAAADVFIAPTMYETFSIAGYEAAACGLPIVATKVNGLEDLIGEHQQRGRFIGNDAASIASVAFELAGAPQLRRELGERARQYATEFTWDRSATTVLEAYEKIMAGKTR